MGFWIWFDCYNSTAYTFSTPSKLARKIIQRWSVARVFVNPFVGHRFASCLEDGNALGRDDRRNEEKQGEENVRFHGMLWLIGIESIVGFMG